MTTRRQKQYRYKFNQGALGDGIKGKVIESISVWNEPECRYISLEFGDKTELTITLYTCLTGKLELFDCKNGDQRLIRKIGLIAENIPILRLRE